MARARTGEAIGTDGRVPSRLKTLKSWTNNRQRDGSLDEWRRGRAVLQYIEGWRVIDIAAMLGVTRGSVNRWLQWYEAMGIEGLVTAKAPGAAPKLNEEQREVLAKLVDAGPRAAGYSSGCLDGADGRRPHRGKVRRALPQAQRAPASA